MAGLVQPASNRRRGGPPDEYQQTRAILTIQTPHGEARAEIRRADGRVDVRAEDRVHVRAEDRVGALVLGHGAGGGIHAPDLLVAAAAALDLGLAVALVEQPYRVAGRRSPAPSKQLDAAWCAVIAHLREHELSGVPLITGGRSSGARIACRTAAETGTMGVLCLAFPLHPPGRAADPAKSRLRELETVRVPVLIVQGERDPFGMPPEAPNRDVVRVPGDHSLRQAGQAQGEIASWIATLITT